MLVAYHGSNGRFNKFDQSKSRIENDLYGGGVAYFTDSVDIAKSYAAYMARRNGGDKVIYKVILKMNKIFDVDKLYRGSELLQMIGNNFEQFARAAKLLRLGVDKLQLLSRLKSGEMALSGDQVFKGMSNGMINTKVARERLVKLGFDGLRYNGGVQMGGSRHNVYLAYNASQIDITDRMIVSPTPVPSEEANQVYRFIN